MSTIFMLFMILVSSDGIFGLVRKDRATHGDTTDPITTDRNIIADYISQKIRGIEQATELGNNPNFSPPNVPNFSMSTESNAHPHAKHQKEMDTATVKHHFIMGSHPAIPLRNQKIAKDDTSAKKIHNNVKSINDHQERFIESTTINPDGYAMRISAETFEIDAMIDPTNITEDLGHRSNLTETETETENENENGNLDLELELEEIERNRQTTEGSASEDGNMSGEVTTMNPIDEEIKHVLEALPKLPVLTFDQFTFHKDPEESALDDRITQVARQLAETSLRREFEEKKLGHYIPIRLRHFDDEYPNAYNPAKQLTNDRSYNNALEILRQIQDPQVKFRALAIPQHVYNGPLYRTQGESIQSPTQLHLHKSQGPVYVKESEGNTRMSVAPIFNPNGFGAIIQLGPRYGVPVPKVSLEQNRIPLFFSLTQPKSAQSFHNRNDLNTYPRKEIP